MCPIAGLTHSHDLARRLGDVDIEVHALNNLGTTMALADQEHGVAVMRSAWAGPAPSTCRSATARAYANLSATPTR